MLKLWASALWNLWFFYPIKSRYTYWVPTIHLGTGNTAVNETGDLLFASFFPPHRPSATNTADTVAMWQMWPSCGTTVWPWLRGARTPACCSGGWSKLRRVGFPETWGPGRVRWWGCNSIFGRCLLPSRVIYTQSMSIAKGVMGVGGWTDRQKSLFIGVGRGVTLIWGSH